MMAQKGGYIPLFMIVVQLPTAGRRYERRLASCDGVGIQPFNYLISFLSQVDRSNNPTWTLACAVAQDP